MKKIFPFFLVIVLNSCTNNVEIESLKYSSKDLAPLNDSSKNLYYDDAAFIEYEQLLKDSVKKYEQIKLNENNIQSYYEDLIYIYSNCFKISNSFFEYAKSLHSPGAITLYQILVFVDTSKNWTVNWRNGIKNTGVIEIDSIINNYNLDINYMEQADSTYWFEIKSQIPINYFALIEEFKKTNEFITVEPVGLIGGGSNISLENQYNSRNYRYNYGWGDCPSGCINYHYWIVKLKDKEIELIEEGGDSLN